MSVSESDFKYKSDWLSWPIIRHLRAMRFRRLIPLAEGRSNGLSTIRYYWHDFLDKHRHDIQGLALEIGNTETIRRYGDDQLTQADALDLSAHDPEVRVVADLSRADHVPGDQYDCFVNQFTTAVIYDIEAALYHAIRLLKPGGVLLINFWCVDFYLYRGVVMESGVPFYMYWWFTPIQVENMLHQLGLTKKDYTLDIYGNLVTRMAFLMNLPAHELTRKELDFNDPGQPLLICARIVKPDLWQAEKPAYREPRWKPSDRPVDISSETSHYGDVYHEKS